MISIQKPMNLQEKNNLPYIYLMINNINGRTYVGQHYGGNKYYIGSGKLLKQAIKKYDIENFTRTILKQGNFNQILLDELERHYIQLYSPAYTPNSYNLAIGGNGSSGVKRTEVQKQKTSQALITYNNNLSPEEKEKKRLRMLGNTIMNGKVLSDETKLKMKNIRLGKKLTEETKKKLSDFRSGSKMSEEHKRAVFEGRRKFLKPVLQFKEDGTLYKEYISIEDAVRNSDCTEGLIKSSLKKSLDNITKVSNGFYWIYKNKY